MKKLTWQLFQARIKLHLIKPGRRDYPGIFRIRFEWVAKGVIRLQLLQMIWNGINGLGPGTVLLKALFILSLGAVFWMICELIKHMVNVFARLAAASLRYLSIIVRGWPKNPGEDEENGEKFSK